MVSIPAILQAASILKSNLTTPSEIRELSYRLGEDRVEKFRDALENSVPSVQDIQKSYPEIMNAIPEVAAQLVKSSLPAAGGGASSPPSASNGTGSGAAD